MPLKIVFAGTPSFAAEHLHALIEAKHNIIAVYSQPDRRAGRGKKLLASPVKQLALEHDIPVYQPQSLKDETEQETLAALQPDLMIVVAYGLILPQAVLDIPRLGCINVHASILPRWRGAAPIERALLAGDEYTGVTIMQMDRGLDTGDMLYKAQVPITQELDRQMLEEALAKSGREALLHTLAHIEELKAQAEKQDDSLSTYAAKLDKREALIDWNSDAQSIDRIVRCGIGRTPAYTYIDEDRVRIIEAKPVGERSHQANGVIISADKNSIRIACQDSVLQVTKLQMPGKNPVTAAEVLNARREQFAPGKRFTNGPDQ
ncbi:MAG: methionyl-tRNA formyltransferase [Pseudohongiellaceae bacterium]|nr:methionyl-tRNA formyltransferase [Pseudohongiellaceae bacterium]